MKEVTKMRRKKKIITVFTVVLIVVLKFFQRSIVYDGIFFYHINQRFVEMLICRMTNYELLR